MFLQILQRKLRVERAGFPPEAEERGSHLTKSLAGAFCGDENLVRTFFTKHKGYAWYFSPKEEKSDRMRT